MSRTDRAVRRACHHLASDEALLACALGIEADGRRRQVVLLTDRRVLVAGLRAQPPDELGLTGCTAEYDRTGALLTLRQGERQLVVRDIAEPDAQRIEGVLARRRTGTLATAPSEMRHVRVLHG